MVGDQRDMFDDLGRVSRSQGTPPHLAFDVERGRHLRDEGIERVGDDLSDLRARAQLPIKECPCCGASNKVYKRKLSSTMTATMCVISTIGEEGEWVHLNRVPRRFIHGGEVAQLQHWELLEHRGETIAPESAGLECGDLPQRGAPLCEGTCECQVTLSSALPATAYWGGRKPPRE